ncbi:hypothetical protein B484DRAFT_410786 [Ochromonadaceae sp. CCMP2298]|nr:hypothetical protein B484DRAFT_410786 [Ochromonadaceae sp. CCMP2298]
MTLHQLKYSGLFEAIRIRKSGFALRVGVEAFVARYKHTVKVIPQEGGSGGSVIV